jgi:hypothetical protein
LIALSIVDSDIVAIESLVDREAKKPVVAYIFWLFLGWFGAHRFYAGRPKSAFAMLALSLSAVGLPVSILWWLADAFVLPSILHEERELLFDQKARILLEDRKF